MDKRDVLLQAFAVKDQPSDAVKIIKIISLGVFFTTVVTISVFFAIRHGTITAGSIHPCPITPAEDHKLMGTDLNHVTDLKMADGQIIQERFRYDHRSNSVMVQTPASGSGDYLVTFVIDYNRALVFVHVHEQDVCMVYSLREEFGQSVRKELSKPDRHVIDVASTVVIKEKYEVAGEIPSGFVEASSGPMVDGICGGRTTYWLDRLAGNNRESGREKRATDCYSYNDCIGNVCYHRTVCYEVWDEISSGGGAYWLTDV